MSQKIKVKCFLCLVTHHASKTYQGEKLKPHTFFNWSSDGDEWSDSRSGRFTAHGKSPLDRRPEPVWTRWRAGNLTPLVQLLTSHVTDFTTLVHLDKVENK